MRLGVDGRELVPGARTGIGRYVIEVVKTARRQGWDCVVYGNQSTVFPDAAAETRPMRLHEWSRPWWDQISLRRRLREDRIDVFLSPYYKGPVFAPCPAVLTIHDLFFIGYLGRSRPWHDRLMTTLAKLYAASAAAIIADSHYSKRAIVARLGVEAARIRVIPVGLGEEFRPVALTPNVAIKYGLVSPYLLYVGNFKPHKNLDTLLEAFALLPRAERRKLQLVLAGGDATNRPALEDRACRLRIDHHVRFTGLVADRDLPQVYSGATLFVMPSLEEGFGLPALEAMACGAPVAAAERAAIPEVVGAAGLFFDPEKPRALADTLLLLLNDAKLRDRVRAAGLQRAQEFSAEKTSGAVLSLLTEVAEKGQAA
jgi:glycosyltransferase involved in cell wall biosynthesis